MSLTQLNAIIHRNIDILDFCLTSPCFPLLSKEGDYGEGCYTQILQ
jgi:hypothetical protein